MPEAARKDDNHTCPLVDPPAHKGGPIKTPCAQKVYIGGKLAARKTDLALCEGTGALDPIIKGSQTVLIENLQAARKDDPTAHGGIIVEGCTTVIIGDNAQKGALKKAAAAGKALCRDCSGG